MHNSLISQARNKPMRIPFASWGGFTDPANPRYFTWTQFFVNILTKFPVTETPYEDPRISKIMKPAPSDNKYWGLRSGAGLARRTGWNRHLHQ